MDNIKGRIFDITIFGSSSQYIENFEDEVLDLDIVNSNKILFTHTPFSIESGFISNQYTGFTGHQFVRSYSDLCMKMKQKGYDIIFKSIMPSNSASVEEKFINKTVYSNILFKKNSN